MAAKRQAAKAKITPAQFNALIERELILAHEFGMRAERIGPGSATLRLRFAKNHIRPGGTIAGPVMMALADVTLYAVVLSLLGQAELAVTTSLNVNFLKKPKPADLLCHGRILKLGKRLAVGECSLYSEGEDDLVAHVTGTYSLPPR
jgi:uncharacterized protein (TIGR00369 family)